MARIPTMNPMSITAPPGSAGGVKLGPTGVGAVPIQTPLTQRYNPSEFGKEGAAIAQLGQAIFNDAVIPMMELQKRNAKAKETLDQSSRLYGEMTSIKGELAKNQLTPGFDYLSPVHESKAWAKHFKGINTSIDGLLPSIKANVSDPKHAVALSNAFMPQIMQLKLKAQNRAIEVSENSTVLAYQKGLQDLVNELALKLPTEVPDGENTYIFRTKDWEGLMQKKQLLDNLFEASGVNPTKKYKEQLAGRQLFVDQLTGVMLQNPEMGLAFLEKGYAEKFGINPAEKGEMMSKLEKLQLTQIRTKNYLNKQKELADDAAAKLEVEEVLIDHSVEAKNGDMDLMTWATWEQDYKDGGYHSTWTRLNTKIQKRTPTPGLVSDPKEFKNFADEVQAALSQADPEVVMDLIERINDSGLEQGHILKFTGDLATLKNAASMLKWHEYEMAEKTLRQAEPVPSDTMDDTTKKKSVAIWGIFNAKKIELMRSGKFKQFDWPGFARQLIEDHSGNYDKIDDVPAQIRLKQLVTESGYRSEPGAMIEGASGKFYPDVTQLRVLLLRDNAKGIDIKEVNRRLAVITEIGDDAALNQKIAEIKKERNKQNPPPPKTISGPQQFMRDITKDEWEAMGKKYFPEEYKTLFGETPEKTAPVETKPAPPEVTEEQLREAIEKRLAPVPKPEPEPVGGKVGLSALTGKQIGTSTGAFPGRPVIGTVDGGASHVRLTHFPIQTSEGQKWTYFPTMFNGAEVNEQEAMSLAKKYNYKDPESGHKSQFFNTPEEALDTVKKLSQDSTWVPVKDKRQTEMFPEEKPEPTWLEKQKAEHAVFMEKIKAQRKKEDEEWDEYQAQQKKELEDFLKGL
jgi:hypothetical protein